MAASPSEVAKRAICDRRMGGREIDDRDVPPGQNSEQIAIGPAGGVAIGDHDGLELRRRADQTIILGDEGCERRRFRLVPDDRDQGRRVEGNHFGKPNSS
jgi:hypothetical protein